MDIFLIRVFQGQVLIQCRAVLAAAEDTNRALSAQDASHVFIGIQNLLNATANISKALWGQRGKFTLERQELRNSIGVAEDSPLRDPDMRNNFEHFDERLNLWWRDSKRHNIADLLIGPATMIQGLDEADMFRHFNPETTDIMFWSQPFNLQAIVNEVQRILPTVQREAAKPHWETRPPTQREESPA